MNKFKRILGPLLLSATMTLGAQLACAGDAPVLYPIVKDGLWGYINANGETVVNPQYKRAGFFFDGLALVSTNEPDKRRLYIDTSGKVVIEVPQERRYPDDFSEGLAAQKDSENGNYGFIDMTGQLAVPFKYLSVKGFSEGLASVELEQDGKYLRGYINSEGEMVVPLMEGNANSFSDGMASVGRRSSENRMRYGYIDKSGKLMIPLQYKKAGDFSEGHAFVLTADKELQLIDKSAAVIATFPYKVGDYDSMPVFSDGYAKPGVTWQKEGVAWGFIDKNGKIAFLHLNIRRIKADFSEGLAWVSLIGSDDGVCIDTSGKEIFRVADVSKAMPFNHGVSAVQKRGEQGVTYYDATGKLVWTSTE